MSCPVCHYSHLTPSDSQCPQCSTPMTTLELLMDMKYQHRKEEGEKIAMGMLVMVLFLFATALVYFYNDQKEVANAELEEGMITISADSVRDLSFTVQEQENEVEQLMSRISVLENEVDSMTKVAAQPAK